MGTGHLGLRRGHQPWAPRQTLHRAFRRLITQRSPYRHAVAYAALGAAPLVSREPAARSLVSDAVAVIASPSPQLPVVRRGRGLKPGSDTTTQASRMPLCSAGQHWGVASWSALVRGVEFLVSVQVVRDHLSVVPVGGRGPGQDPLGFDQQLELASMAGAAAAGYEVTGRHQWRQIVDAAAAWFVGDNDVGIAMFDTHSGAGYDGLTRTGRNQNRGAESTVAANSTLLQAHRLAAAAGPPPAVISRPDLSSAWP